MEWTPRNYMILCGTLFSVFILLQFFGSSGSGHKPGKFPNGRDDIPYRRVIVAVGDLHGDLPNMMKVLKMAGVVKEDGSWTGDVDYLVQTGDIVDRGDDTIKMYHYLENLRSEARNAGGNVISHFGNHEIMNLIGDWRYVPQSEIRTFGGVAERQRAITEGFIGRAWRANYSITTRLPLHPSLGDINADYDSSRDKALNGLSHAALSFLHGGLAPHYPNLTPYPSAINAIGSRLVHRLQDRKVQPPPSPPNPYPGLPKDSTEEEHVLYSGDGPLWYRGWATEKDHVVCKAVDHVLKITGVRRLVMGHTPHFSGIVSRCNGKILLIDTGISHAYGGVLSAARFVYTIEPTKKALHWTEREVVHAVYEGREAVLVDESREVVGQFN